MDVSQRAQRAQRDAGVEEVLEDKVERSFDAQVALSPEAGAQLTLHCLQRAVIVNDADTVRRLGQERKLSWHHEDEDGQTLLHLAAALGRKEILALLSASFDATSVDSFGYTPLHWATVTNHPECIETLLEAGAIPDCQSHSSRPALAYAISPSTKAALLRIDLGDLLTERSAPKCTEPQSKSRLFNVSDVSQTLQELDFDPLRYDTGDYSQMMVWRQGDLDRILHEIITNAIPLTSRPWLTLIADSVFLMARWAAWWGTPQMLGDLLLGSVERIESLSATRESDLDMLAFLLSNASLLTTYIKLDHSIRDFRQANLNGSMDELVLGLNDLVSEIVVLIVRSIERTIDAVLEAEILDFEYGKDHTDYQDEWRLVRAFKPVVERRPREPPVAIPRTLASIMATLRRFAIHESIVTHCIAQCLYWLTSEVLNRILAKRKYVSRHKAVQIKLAFSSVEQYVAENDLPLQELFVPLHQLLQWIGCLADFTGTIDQAMNDYPRLSAAQLSRAVEWYRYEVGELQCSMACSSVEQEEAPWPVVGQIEDYPTKPWSLDDYKVPAIPRPAGVKTNSEYLLPFFLSPDVGWTWSSQPAPPKPMLPIELITNLDRLLLEPG